MSKLNIAEYNQKRGYIPKPHNDKQYNRWSQEEVSILLTLLKKRSAESITKKTYRLVAQLKPVYLTNNQAKNQILYISNDNRYKN